MRVSNCFLPPYNIVLYIMTQSKNLLIQVLTRSQILFCCGVVRFQGWWVPEDRILSQAQSIRGWSICSRNGEGEEDCCWLNADCTLGFVTYIGMSSLNWFVGKMYNQYFVWNPFSCVLYFYYHRHHRHDPHTTRMHTLSNRSGCKTCMSSNSRLSCNSRRRSHSRDSSCRRWIKRGMSGRLQEPHS